MPDIFGREAQDYAVVRALQEAEQWDRYQEDNALRRAAAIPEHDFTALQSGVPSAFQRATEDQQAVGYLTNNMLAIQTMVDEIMYTAYRLPMFVHINTDIPEGARSYGVRVRDRVGRAERVSGPGWEAPSATASESLVTQDLHWYGLDAEWSIDELRGAMMAGVPLDTESVEAAVTGTMETMEEVALTGGEYEQPGLLNLPYRTDQAANLDQRVTRLVQAANMTFSDMTAVQIRNLINGRISNIIEVSRETLGRNINTGMTVYLPGTQYDSLTTTYIGDNAERTLMRSILEDNPWTHFTGQPLTIERVLELADRGFEEANNAAGATAADRMVVALKHTRVAEIGVSISPRILRIMDKGRVVCAQVEAKFSPLFPKRPNTIQYVDRI